MTLEKQSPCKINLLLNILGKRPDGFHQLETVMQPVNWFDSIRFERVAGGIELLCNVPELPTDSRNLVYRAAAAFLQKAHIRNHGVRIRLEKRIPLAAGLGGGSGNAACTLSSLNELFGHPLSAAEVFELAAALGSDVPFFLQNRPALATGRGETIQPLEPFRALNGASVLLAHPGFGISTAWAYSSLQRYPEALNGRSGRAKGLVNALQHGDLKAAGAELYNALERPAFEKYPLLALFREFLREHGAASLMSGSGSTVFGLTSNRAAAESLLEKFKSKFGDSCWTAVVPI